MRPHDSITLLHGRRFIRSIEGDELLFCPIGWSRTYPQASEHLQRRLRKAHRPHLSRNIFEISTKLEA